MHYVFYLGICLSPRLLRGLGHSDHMHISSVCEQPGNYYQKFPAGLSL